MHTRSYRHLSAEERETVSLGLARGHSIRAMARILGRAPSTVSRELSRNATRGHPYRACAAQTRGCRPGLSAPATAETGRRVVVAICPEASDGGVFAGADCRAAPPRVSWRHAQAAVRRNYLCGSVCIAAWGCQRRCYKSSNHRSEKSSEHRVTMSLHRSSRRRRDRCCERRTSW